MFLLIIATVLLLPVAEVAATVWVAQRLGWDSTLLLLCAGSLLGWGVLTVAVKASIMTATFDLMRARGSIGQAVAGRFISTAAALLLLLPGFITGIVGLTLLLPPVRGALSRRVVNGLKGSMTTITVNPVDPGPSNGRRDAIEVDIIDVEPAPTQPGSTDNPELG